MPGASYIHNLIRCLEVGCRVGLGRGVIALEGALEGAAGATGATADFALFRRARSAEPSTVADNVVAIFLLASLVAQSPVQHGPNT